MFDPNLVPDYDSSELHPLLSRVRARQPETGMKSPNPPTGIVGMPEHRPYRFHPDALAALVIAVFSVPGIFYSVYITLLKFRADSLCDTQLAAVCSREQIFSCNTVFASELAAPLGVPITVYSASAYLVAGVLALSVICWNHSYQRVVRPLLLWLISLMALTCLGLAAYSIAAFHTLCILCCALYSITLVQFAAVGLMHSDGFVRGLTALLRHFGPRRLKTSLFSVVLFGTATLFQSALYSRASLEAAQQESGQNACLDTFRRLPATSLHVDAQVEREVVLGLFLDFACPGCRIEFERVEELLQTDDVADWLSVELFHFPQDPACSGTLPVGTAHADKLACRAAFAVECVEKFSPGRGRDAVRALFAAQKADQEVVFTDALLSAALAPFADPAALLNCVNAPEPTITNRVKQHAAYAIATAQFTGTPGVLIVGVEPDRSFAHEVRRVIGAQSTSTLRGAINSQRRSRD